MPTFRFFVKIKKKIGKNGARNALHKDLHTVQYLTVTVFVTEKKCSVKVRTGN